MDSRWIWGVVLIIIVAAGGWYAFSHPAAPALNQPTTGQISSNTAAEVPVPVIVSYTDQGFSPKSVTIAQGQPVTWVNNSSATMWVASGVHPVHSAYDGTSRSQHCAAGYNGPAPFDECAAVAAGGSFTFTFDKAGDWKYHNHIDSGDTGEVVVTAAPAAGISTSTTVNVH